MRTSNFFVFISNRGNIYLCAITFLFVVVFFRLFQIQILNASKYRALAREQHWSKEEFPAKRGTIYTADGFPVAMSIAQSFLSINITPETSQNEIKKILYEFYDRKDIDQCFANAFQKFGQSADVKRYRCEFAQPITIEQKNIILNATNNSRALSFNDKYTRVYPEKDMLSHVLGFLGKNNKGDQVAYYGLEQYYDGYLSGRDGLLVQEKDASGKPILFGGVASYDGIDGSDLSLTIDRKKQFILEKHLKESFERHNPKSAVGIILEPQTGKVLAMAKYPSFIPSDYREIEDQVTIRNDAIGGVYEPGSILKSLTMSVAIDLGKVKPEDTYNDTGPKIFSDYTVDNWDGKHHGVIDMTRVLQLSNNIGIAWVGKQAGDAQLIEYFKQYGMNKFTGIDLGGEEKGLMNDNLPLRDIELANLSFGQGISVTPIQMAMAFTAIANNGTMMKPYIVSKIKSSDKEQIINPQPIAKPISAQTASIMVDMLTQTVSGGEAKFFVSKKYMIAGKTGTAQVPVKGGYSPDRTNATFVGFLPKYKNFVMLIKLEEPTSPSGYAAETAVPTWMAIADELAGLDGLLPDRQ